MNTDEEDDDGKDVEAPIPDADVAATSSMAFGSSRTTLITDLVYAAENGDSEEEHEYRER